jgi:DNA (cytosine-5)-methyltransferase 1
MVIRIGSLFSGIGGFELGLERAIPNSETIWQVEQEKFCQKVLAKHWPNAKIYDDVRNITKNNVEPVDILCGGFPCQDISVAGKGAGINEGKKSSLWWEMHRIISELRPRIVVLENVPAITFRGLDDVLGSLSQIGYNAEWCIISARQFGAPHLRKRWFCVAYPHESTDAISRDERKSNKSSQTRQAISRTKNQGWQESGGKTQFHNRGCGNLSYDATNSNLQRCQKQFFNFTIKQSRQPKQSNFSGQGRKSNYWQGFPTQPSLCRRNDGVSNRVDRIKALGNAIVPQCSEWIGQRILESGLLEDLR